MIFAALDEAATKGQLILVNGGMCRWHRRRDGVVVIREIIVLPELRRRGIARGMVATIRQCQVGLPVEAKCPQAYTSNAFWSGLGFRLVECDGKVNRWRLDPN